MIWTRLLISAVALFGGLGGLLADFSPSHLLNPDWPPHARFHNAQTMSIGALLALATLGFAWVPTGAPRLQLVAAAVLGTMIWASIFAAQFFPGVAFTDPRFAAEQPMLLGQPVTQSAMGLVLLVLVWLAVLITLRAQSRKDQA